MIGLFESFGDVFSLSDVASIQHRPGTPGNAERYIVNKFSGRGTSLLFSYEYEELMARPAQLIPATPETFLLRGFVDDEGAFLDALPVLAWAICIDGQTRPVLPSGVSRRLGCASRTEFVRLPDGGIYEFGCEVDPDRYADEDAVRAHLWTRYQREREQRAKDAAALEAEGGA